MPAVTAPEGSVSLRDWTGMRSGLSQWIAISLAN